MLSSKLDGRSYRLGIPEAMSTDINVFQHVLVSENVISRAVNQCSAMSRSILLAM